MTKEGGMSEREKRQEERRIVERRERNTACGRKEEEGKKSGCDVGRKLVRRRRGKGRWMRCKGG